MNAEKHGHSLVLSNEANIEG